MSRESRIQYNPALSVKENAKKNGVSEAAIRDYIKTHSIDRRYDRKQNIIEDCRKYLKKHPKATLDEIQKKSVPVRHVYRNKSMPVQHAERNRVRRYGTYLKK